MDEIPIKREDRISVTEAQSLCLKQNISFFSYSLPGSPDRHFGAQMNEKPELFRGFAISREKNGFVFSPFDTNGSLPALFIPEDIAFTNWSEEINDRRRLEAVHHPSLPLSHQDSDCNREVYDKQIATFISAFKQGVLKKAILSRTITLPGDAYEKAPLLFDEMVREYPDAFVFLVSVPGIATWIGATPEIFLQQTTTALSTMSLAGTQAATGKADSVVWEYKDREEQQIVSDYITGIFKRTCGSRFSVTGPQTLRAGNVYHLCTHFECPVVLPGERADAMCRELHPTPAVGGFPKEPALTLIRQTERHDRRYYAGYLGPVRSDGTFNLYVNLRSMELFPDAFRLYAGGGITALSDADKEWQESGIKAQTMSHLIDML